LEVVAEGRPATLWNPQGSLHEVELLFTPADTTSARDAAREVFPGCPLTSFNVLLPVPQRQKNIKREYSLAQWRVSESAEYGYE
jgi:hypothetical protein